MATRIPNREGAAYTFPMPRSALHAAPSEAASLLARGRRLEYLTIAWNSFEAVVALASGMMAGSVALIGFGLDSVIETASAFIVLWRFRGSERREQTARRLVGVCFLLLAAYVAMIGLAEIRIDARAGDAPSSILQLFAGSGKAAPPGLSAWDEAFLRAIYHIDHLDQHQLARVKTAMVGEIAPH